MLPKNRGFYGITILLCLLLGTVLGQASVASQTGLGGDSEPISLDVRQMNLVDVLRLIADKANVNIIIGREVTAADVVVTMRLKDVDLWQALEAVLKVSGFGYLEEEGIIRIVKKEELVETKPPLTEEGIILKHVKAEKAQTVCEYLLSPSGTLEIDSETNALVIKDTAKNIEKIRQVITELDVQPPPIFEERRFQLNHVDLEKEEEKSLLESALGTMVGEEGTFFVDPLTNSIYVKVASSSMKAIENYLKKADAPIKRIMIKAEFVEVRLSESEELGIRWRWKGAYDNYPLGSTFRYPYYASPEPGEVPGPRAPLSTLAGLGIIFGSVEQEFRGLIDLLISEDKADLLSSPSIVTLDGRKATIHVGDRYPYKIKSWKEGELFETTEFLDLGATLVVTPRVKEGNRIILDIQPSVSEITAKALWEGGPPVVGTRDTTTQIEVEDGETLVIGGLLKENEKETRVGVPFLSRIPILGALFTYKTMEKEKTDLLIFITPYILTKMEQENLAEKLKSTRSEVEELYQKGLDYKESGEHEKAQEFFQQTINKSLAYGFFDYLSLVEKELAELSELEKSRLELEEKGKEEKPEPIEKQELEMGRERIEKPETEAKKVSRETLFGIGLGRWFSSVDGGSFMIYEAQLAPTNNVRFFTGGGKAPDESSSVAYFGGEIGDKLNIGMGGLQSSTQEKIHMMITAGFSLGTEKVKFEAKYLYIPEDKDSSGTKVVLGIKF